MDLHWDREDPRPIRPEIMMTLHCPKCDEKLVADVPNAALEKLYNDAADFGRGSCQVSLEARFSPGVFNQILLQHYREKHPFDKQIPRIQLWDRYGDPVAR